MKRSIGTPGAPDGCGGGAPEDPVARTGGVGDDGPIAISPAARKGWPGQWHVRQTGPTDERLVSRVRPSPGSKKRKPVPGTQAFRLKWRCSGVGAESFRSGPPGGSVGPHVRRGGDIRLIAFIAEPEPIRKMPTHLGEPLEPQVRLSRPWPAGRLGRVRAGPRRPGNLSGVAGLAALARGSRRRTAPRCVRPEIDVGPEPDTVGSIPERGNHASGAA